MNFGPHYWLFTVTFWLAAGGLKWLDGMRIDHWYQVSIRFMYFPVVGLLVTSLMTLLFGSAFFQRIRHPFPSALVLAAVGALVTASILNPITYLLLGYDLAARHFELMTTGLIEFAVFYLLWISLFFHLTNRHLLGPRPVEAGAISHIDVDERGQTRAIALTDVECLLASGDYVEIHLGERSYLKKATISSMEALLDPDAFARIHRSTIVNRSKIRTVGPSGNGGFEVTLASGRVVNASRSYRRIVDAMR